MGDFSGIRIGLRVDGNQYVQALDGELVVLLRNSPSESELNSRARDTECVCVCV